MWQKIDPKDASTWPPFNKTVLVHQHGGWLALGWFDLDSCDNELCISTDGYESPARDGWYFLIIPDLPKPE